MLEPPELPQGRGRAVCEAATCWVPAGGGQREAGQRQTRQERLRPRRCLLTQRPAPSAELCLHTGAQGTCLEKHVLLRPSTAGDQKLLFLPPGLPPAALPVWVRISAALGLGDHLGWPRPPRCNHPDLAWEGLELCRAQHLQRGLVGSAHEGLHESGLPSRKQSGQGGPGHGPVMLEPFWKETELCSSSQQHREGQVKSQQTPFVSISKSGIS